METKILDLGNHPEIYSEQIGDVVFVGSHVRIVFVSWRKVNGVMRKCVAAEIIRPTETLMPHAAKLWQEQFACGATPRPH